MAAFATIKYYREDTGRWQYTDGLYRKATARVRHVGEVSLSPRHGYRFRMYLVRAYKPRIGRPPLTRPQGGRVRQYRRLHKAPWLLATSLPHDKGSCRRIKHFYAQRMQIEETFRDTQSRDGSAPLDSTTPNHTPTFESLETLLTDWRCAQP